MEGETKCNCQRCGQPIAFPLDLNNTEAPCPLCGMETTLQAPRIRALARNNPQPTEIENYTTLVVVGFVGTLIIPLIGFIAGIYLIVKGKAGVGAVMLVLSILLSIIWLAAFSDL
jgi:predicted RNA-binding Zn-ribbon protein involved in translation (DUF1610 family)